MMYVIHNREIKEIKAKNKLKQLFCKHELIIGDECSKMGQTRINGDDIVTVCVKCGKVLEMIATMY